MVWFPVFFTLLHFQCKSGTTTSAKPVCSTSNSCCKEETEWKKEKKNQYLIWLCVLTCLLRLNNFPNNIEYYCMMFGSSYMAKDIKKAKFWWLKCTKKVISEKPVLPHIQYSFESYCEEQHSCAHVRFTMSSRKLGRKTIWMFLAAYSSNIWVVFVQTVQEKWL